MGVVYHDELAEGSNHIVYDFSYDNYTEREAATGFLSRDLNKHALQSDNGSVWRLVQITPVIIWKMVSGPDETYKDLNIYLDPTGNDTTGDGSETYPYRTFPRVFEAIPYWVRHQVKIFPTAGAYAEFPSVIARRYTEEGRIIIDASGETYPVSAGPYTVTNVSDAGGTISYGIALGTDLQVGGTPWTTDQWHGKFIHILTGNWTGYVLPVWKNTTDTIRTYADWFTFNIGDTFDIVDCPVTIDIDHRVYIKGEGSSLFFFNVTPDIYSPITPYFVLCGLKIRSDSGKDPFLFENVVSFLTYCTFIDAYDTLVDSIPIRMNNASINFSDLISGTLANGNLESFNPPLHILSMDGAVPIANGVDIEVCNSHVANCCCRRTIRGYHACGDNISFAVFCGRYEFLSRGNNEIMDAFIEQLGYTDSGIEGISSTILTSNINFERVNQPMDLSQNSYLKALWLIGTTILATYALKIQSISGLTIESNVTVLGSSGAVEFPISGTTHAAWPTTGTGYTDSLGSNVIAE